MKEGHLSEASKEFTLKRVFYSVLTFYIMLLIWFVSNDYRQTVKKAKDEGFKTATIASLQVRSTFEQVRNILIIISSELPEDNEPLIKKDSLSQYLYSRNMLISDIEYLLLTDKDGKILSSSIDIPDNIANTDHLKDFTDAGNSQGIYAKQRKSIISNEWIISFIHKAVDKKNNFRGIIEASVPLSLWYQYFKQQKIFPNDEISIVYLKDCSILGTSTKVGDEFKSAYINEEFCKKHLENVRDRLSNSYIDKESKNAINYVILPEFKIAVTTISTPGDFLEAFYKRSLILILGSIAILFIFWKLIKYQELTEEKLRQERILQINSSKMASLGEMAGGIAHEINTPLAIINMKVEQLKSSIEDNEFRMEDLSKSLLLIKKTTDRIAKIVRGLRFFARDGSSLPMEDADMDSILEDTLSFCSEKMRVNNVKLTVEKNYLTDNLIFKCRAVEISQVILNLLNNANDAISEQNEKWINLSVTELSESIEISIVDSGKGIPKELQEKIMQPFFTTKEVGKGTGLGLTITRGIISSHKGKFSIDPTSPNTKFVITLPKGNSTVS